MKNTKLVSVIMPVYNVELYIKKAVESILNQTYFNFELLIIDDGTQDNSIKVIEPFLLDNRVKVFHKENGGLSDARNYGLQKASGEFVCFVDSDDFVEPELLTCTINEIERVNADVLLIGYFSDTEDLEGNLIESIKVISNYSFFEKTKNPIQIDNNVLGLLGYAWNKVYRRKFLLENKIQFEKGISLVEDILFNCQVFQKINSVVVLDKAYYHYANRPVQTLIKQFHSNSFELYLKKTKSLSNLFLAWELPLKESNVLLANSLILGLRYCANNLFAFKNSLTEIEKYRYLKMMLNHPKTVELIPFYSSYSYSDKIYKAIILNKCNLLLYLTCKLLK